jgi:hypothetical protein
VRKFSEGEQVTGVKGRSGRRRDPELGALLAEYVAAGLTLAAIARELGVTPQSVRSALEARGYRVVQREIIVAPEKEEKR